jgi:hypothetical protein
MASATHTFKMSFVTAERGTHNYSKKKKGIILVHKVTQNLTIVAQSAIEATGTNRMLHKKV